MRHLITIALLSLITISLSAQENNPLINSGELIDKAIALHDEGKYKEAIDLYKKVTRGDTNYYRVLYEMAYSQVLDSQFVEARKNCEMGLAFQNEKWPEFFTLYANLIDDTGDAERALRIYDSAINLYPAYSDLYLNKGATLFKLERFAEAEEVYKQCLLINPYQASAHYRLGLCAMERGQIVQAFLSHLYYLLIQPSGRHQSKCINSLSNISKAGEDIKKIISERKEEASDNFGTLEKIMLSKIALDKQYKPLLKLDDPISRQIQVLLEKLEYDEKDPDFWMQYYVPLVKSFFTGKKFEPFINRLFAAVKIEAIQDYLKKNKKEIQEVVDETVAYCNQIRDTREINYAVRKGMNSLYHFTDSKLYGKGELRDKGETLAGNWEFYFTSGNLRSKGKYNEKGEKEGTWKYYHFNGKLRGTQDYKASTQTGKEDFYYENGNASSSAVFKDGFEDGETKSWYAIGSPRIAVHYKAGKMNGERTTYYSSGNMQGIENYKEDSLHGIFKTFHKTGPLESQGNYNNGKLEGPYKVFFENGKLSMEGTYVNGKLKGPWKQYHENGKLKLQETFADGLAEGDYVEYYDNGQLFYKCIYTKGKVSGDVEYLTKEGKRFFIYTFDNDVPKAVRYFDTTGKEISRSEKKSKKLDLTTYYIDGFKRSQASYNDKGEQNGMETFFFRSGKPSSENMYEDGALEREGTHYYPNGKKQSTINYSAGEKHGYQKFWYSHGQLQEEGWYQNGSMEGTWYSYDEQGNISYISEYLDNELNGYREEYSPGNKKDNEYRYKLGWLEEFVQFDTTGKEINRWTLKNGTGKVKSVFFNGKTYAEGGYLNGELDGPYKYYFFDGKLNTVQFYKNGFIDSIYRNYYYSGLPAVEGHYKMGEKDGVWKNYFSSGKLNYIEPYVNGEVTGKRIYYFQNGKVDTEIEVEKDEKNGWTKKYDDEGNLIYQIRFDENMPVAYTYQDKSGKLVPEIPIPGGTGKIKTFFANGNPSAEFEYADGLIHASNIIYHSNGKLRSKGVEDYGLSEGNYKYYYPNGQLQYDYTYLHDNMHGAYKEYNEKGIVTEEGYYYNGEPHNILKKYDATGKLTETRYYYYGKLLDIKK